jgi:hypothetical protein
MRRKTVLARSERGDFGILKIKHVGRPEMVAHGLRPWRFSQLLPLGVSCSAGDDIFIRAEDIAIFGVRFNVSTVI